MLLSVFFQCIFGACKNLGQYAELGDTALIKKLIYLIIPFFTGHTYSFPYNLICTHVKSSGKFNYNRQAKLCVAGFNMAHVVRIYLSSPQAAPELVLEFYGNGGYSGLYDNSPQKITYIIKFYLNYIDNCDRIK